MCLLIQWPTMLQRLYIKTALFNFSSIVCIESIGFVKKIDVDYFAEISLLMSPAPKKWFVKEFSVYM